MNDIAPMLFSLQRFQMLALYGNSAAERTISAGYAYAWWRSVYPLLNHSAPWHGPYAACFAVSEPKMAELHGLLSQRWSEQAPLTFYELEDHYGVRGSNRPGSQWSQQRLIHACKYLYLERQLDEAFWNALLAGDRSPKEAEIILRPLGPADFQFE